MPIPALKDLSWGFSTPGSSSGIMKTLQLEYVGTATFSGFFEVTQSMLDAAGKPVALNNGAHRVPVNLTPAHFGMVPNVPGVTIPLRSLSTGELIPGATMTLAQLMTGVYSYQRMVVGERVAAEAAAAEPAPE